MILLGARTCMLACMHAYIALHYITKGTLGYLTSMYFSILKYLWQGLPPIPDFFPLCLRFSL